MTNGYTGQLVTGQMVTRDKWLHGTQVTRDKRLHGTNGYTGQLVTGQKEEEEEEDGRRGSTSGDAGPMCLRRCF